MSKKDPLKKRKLGKFIKQNRGRLPILFSLKTKKFGETNKYGNRDWRHSRIRKK